MRTKVSLRRLARAQRSVGMTETFTIVSLPRHDQKVGTLGSAGILVPGVTARVVRPDGTDCAPDEAGQFVLQMPSLALGYLNNEKAYVHCELCATSG